MVKQFYVFSLLITFSLILLSNSCEEDKSKKPVDNDSTNKSTAAVSMEQKRIDSVRTAKEDEYLKNTGAKEKQKALAEIVTKEKNLSQKELQEFLPKEITGFDELPGTAGKTVENDTAVTVYVRKQFRDQHKRTILFDIYDYGRGNPVVNAQLYRVTPTDLDAPAFPVDLPQAKGFFYWLDQKSYGHIEVIAGNRFVLVVRLNGFNRDDKLLTDYLNKINIKSLIISGK